MTPERAEEIAIAALAWLMADDDLLPVFLAASGASAQDLRAQLLAEGGPDKGFLESVLDVILMRDDTVLACCAALELAPDQVQIAHAVVSGRARMHWT